jgi:hypothetical protein
MRDDLLLNRFTNQTIVCVASGPSLTKEQIEYVNLKSKVTFVSNSSAFDFPNATVLFSYDHKWYNYYNDKLKQFFKGAKFCKDKITETSGFAFSLVDQEWFKAYGNTGATLLSLALHANPSKVILVGYDLKQTDKSHYHGDHPEPLGNCNRIEMWKDDFKELYNDYKAQIDKIEIYNCSLDSNLDLFPRQDLKKVLW